MTKILESDDISGPIAATAPLARSPVIGFLLRIVLTVSMLLIGVVAFTTVATWIATSNWLADLCANLRIQQVIGLFGLSLVFALYRRWRCLALSILLVILHLPSFGNLGVAEPSVPPRKPRLVVMTANVWTPNRQHDAIAEQIHQSDADVVAVLELGTPLHQYLEDKLVMSYPHQFAFPQDNGNFGIGLYSKHPLADTEAFTLNIGSILTLAATVEVSALKYRVIATHPLPPMGKEGFANRNEHMRDLAEKIRSQKNSYSDSPMIVMGDLNLTPWSPLFDRFEANSKLRRATCGLGITPTWYSHSGGSFPFGLVLDHVLISDDLDCVSHQVCDAMGSDHRAVIVGVVAAE